MKELLIQAAQRSGVVDAQLLRDFFDQHADDQRRIDQILLTAPTFTEDMVLRLFAEALGIPFLDEINPSDVPREFIEQIPAPYVQHHYLIGIRPQGGNGLIRVIAANPLNMTAVDNISKMLRCPVEMGLSTRAAITAAIDVAYEQKNTVIEEVAEELDAQ
ncbi:MAG TPA: hypothetical protein PKW71_11005, partial [Anaerohalosphaeraceae bacterium]|nr:hypothetical protein [Anaerohalosphaeraceae bacterium]